MTFRIFYTQQMNLLGHKWLLMNLMEFTDDASCQMSVSIFFHVYLPLPVASISTTYYVLVFSPLIVSFIYKVSKSFMWPHSQLSNGNLNQKVTPVPVSKVQEIVQSAACNVLQVWHKHFRTT